MCALASPWISVSQRSLFLSAYRVSITFSVLISPRPSISISLSLWLFTSLCICLSPTPSLRLSISDSPSPAQTLSRAHSHTLQQYKNRNICALTSGYTSPGTSPSYTSVRTVARARAQKQRRRSLAGFLSHSQTGFPNLVPSAGPQVQNSASKTDSILSCFFSLTSSVFFVWKKLKLKIHKLKLTNYSQHARFIRCSAISSRIFSISLSFSSHSSADKGSTARAN